MVASIAQELEQAKDRVVRGHNTHLDELVKKIDATLMITSISPTIKQACQDPVIKLTSCRQHIVQHTKGRAQVVSIN